MSAGRTRYVDHHRSRPRRSSSPTPSIQDAPSFRSAAIQRHAHVQVKTDETNRARSTIQIDGGPAATLTWSTPRRSTSAAS